MAAIVGVKKVLADPVSVIRTNMGGCEHLFDTIATAGSKPRVMIASSSMAYGSLNKDKLSEDDPLMIMSTPQGHWSYAITKIADEAVSFAYNRAHNIPITIMRFFNMAGPRQAGRYGMVMPTFIEQACSGSPITVFGDGTQSRSFCDVRDLVRIINAVAINPKTNGEGKRSANDPIAIFGKFCRDFSE